MQANTKMLRSTLEISANLKRPQKSKISQLMNQHISAAVNRKYNIHHKICFNKDNLISMTIERFSYLESLILHLEYSYLRTRTKEDVVPHYLEAIRLYQLLHPNFPLLHNPQHTSTHLKPSSCIDASQNTVLTLAVEIPRPFERIIQPRDSHLLKDYSITRPNH